MYWYHPHPHGFSEEQVLGGASGALIVEGIAPAKASGGGLPGANYDFADQPIPIGTTGRNSARGNGADEKEDEDGKDLSLNFVPVTYPLYLPAVVRVKPEQREFCAC